MSLRQFLTFAAVVFLPLTAGNRLQAQAYTVTDIGSLNGVTSVAWNLNDRGQVVGWSSQSDPAATTEAVFWSEETGLVALGQVPGLLDSFGIGISNNGTVVGHAGRAFEDVVTFQWTLNEGMTLLPSLGGIDTFADGINDAGQITGVSSPLASNDRFAYIIEGGQITSLGSPAGTVSTSGEAINNLGDILITSEPGSAGPLYLWSDGEFTLLPDLGGLAPGLGRDLNDLGQAVGFSVLPGGGQRAVIWSNGEIRDLGVVNPAAINAVSFARSINNRGMILVEDVSNSANVEIVCEDFCPDGLEGLSGINGELPPGFDLTEAYSINNAGQIVGSGASPDGVSRGLLLTPIDPYPVVINPEPGTAGVTSFLDLLHFNPGAEITLMESSSTGTTLVDGCPGLELQLDNPVDLSTTTVDAEGEGSFSLFVPSSDLGQVRYFQAIDLDNCEVSAVIAHRFLESMSLFVDGFESGDTSSWSTVVGLP